MAELDRIDRKILDILQRQGRISMTDLAAQIGLSKSGDVFDKMRQELLHLPEVMECHLVSGSFDYLVKARLGGMNEYRHLLGDMLKKLPVTAQSHSYVVMEEVKESQVLPMDR